MKTTIIMILLVISQMVIGQISNTEYAIQQRYNKVFLLMENMDGYKYEQQKSIDGYPTFWIYFQEKTHINLIRYRANQLERHLIVPSFEYISGWKYSEESDLYSCSIDYGGFYINMTYLADDNALEIVFTSDPSGRNYQNWN